MLRRTPLFKKNKEWWYYDEKEGKVKLTDKAPEEARKSYEEYYKPTMYNTGIDLSDFEETFEEIKRKLEDKQKSERECI